MITKQKTILFISKGEHSASTRQRALVYFPYYIKAGWQPIHIAMSKNPLKQMQLLKIASHADCVVVLRRGFSLGFLKLLRKCAKQLIYDIDDAVFLRSNGEPSTKRMRRFLQMTKTCDHVWAGNLYLADAANACQNVHIIPTSIDAERYYTSDNQPKDSFDLVWVGSRSTKKYLDAALPIFERLGDAFPDVRLKIIADFDLDCKKLTTVPIQWSWEGQLNALATAHIGIAPMIDNPWTRGKCAMKVLQYMAAGLPVVSSNCGANKEIVKHNKTGLLVDNVDGWVEAINYLKNNEPIRKQQGIQGRELLLEQYSTAATFKLLGSSITV